MKINRVLVDTLFTVVLDVTFKESVNCVVKIMNVSNIDALDEIIIATKASNFLSSGICRNFCRFGKVFVVKTDVYNIKVQAGKKLYAFSMEKLIPRLDYPRNSEATQSLIFQMLLPIAILNTWSILHCDIKKLNYASRFSQSLESETYTTLVAGTSYTIPMQFGKDHVEPVLFDFGLAARGEAFRATDYTVCSIQTKPPELIFVHEGSPMLYTQKSESFSFAITILVLFNYVIDTLSPKFINDIEGHIFNLSQQHETYDVAYHSHTCKDIARYVWKVMMIIGYDGFQAVYGASPLARTVALYEKLIINSPQYLQWEHNANIREYIGESGIAMLKWALRWDAAQRLSPEELLHHPYFKAFVTK